MSKTKQILHLLADGNSQRRIATTLAVSRNTALERIHKDLLKDGVTLAALWEEYCDSCRAAKQPPYMYSQFCKLYSDYVDQHRLTMHIRHKPADKLMVDWAGTKFSYYDSDDVREHTCYLFVATLPFSMYCYAEAFPDMKQASWINAHVHMYAYFGGCTKLLVSDNLKTGVIRHKKHDDPVFNAFIALHLVPVLFQRF